MYSTVGLIKDAPVSGKLVGTHQKLDRVARKLLGKNMPKKLYFPSGKEIVYFEGTRGPDGLKRKSPGVDEPMHFIIPGADDGKLMGYIHNHQYNLREALKNDDRVRASFEAAWLAHSVTDGLTPAHHVPLTEEQDKLMTNKEFVKVFGQPIKGIMHGDNFLQTARNNWLYWGANGHMSQHIAFEYGCAVVATALAPRALTPKLSKKELKNIDFDAEFYKSLEKVNSLDMYNRFRQDGWTTALALQTKNTLLPEIVRAITLAWASCIPSLNPKKPK